MNAVERAWARLAHEPEPGPTLYVLVGFLWILAAVMVAVALARWI